MIIRERKGKYYVYKLENVNSEIRETYVGSLDKVVKYYEKLKVEGVGDSPTPTVPRPGFEPGSRARETRKCFK
ncbi:putative integrase [Sulfolobus tengchongensis]|uniref:Integrase n=1 Tax=Sulfolobus tengchongensis TaxID=207809 RepID=A0AAX4L005_9CREN